MTDARNVQRAGNCSNQTIVQQQVVNFGITENRAEEIARAQADLAVREAFEREAAIIAHKRISRADQKIIAKLTANELLDAFGEPSFLTAFQRAQIGAAQTDDEESYEILANLLTERARAKAGAVKAATLKAIETVDLVEEVALNGLTALWLVSNVTVRAIDPTVGLNHLESIWGSVPYSNLPTGRPWIDHLEALNLIKEEGSMRHKPLFDVLVENCSGWVCVGYTEEEMADYLSAIREKAGIRFRNDAIIPHHYKPGFYRFGAQSKGALVSHLLETRKRTGMPLNNSAEAALNGLLLKMSEIDDQAKVALYEDFQSRIGLATLNDWVAGFKKYLRLTHPGKAMAYTNAKRFHDLDGLPNLADSLVS